MRWLTLLPGDVMVDLVSAVTAGANARPLLRLDSANAFAVRYVRGLSPWRPSQRGRLRARSSKHGAQLVDLPLGRARRRALPGVRLAGFINQ
jgi:hypothetical protein